MRALLVLVVPLSLFGLACKASIPEGRLACSADSDCPGGWVCQSQRCYRDGTSNPDAGGMVDGGSPDSGGTPDGGVGPDALPPVDVGNPDLCQTNADCDNGQFCDGFETCEPGEVGADNRGCVPGLYPCPEGLACFEDSQSCGDIVPVDCSNPDQDGDGAIARYCGGMDCDDLDAAFSPFMPEDCDGMDNNCDGFIDNSAACMGCGEPPFPYEGGPRCQSDALNCLINCGANGDPICQEECLRADPTPAEQGIDCWACVVLALTTCQVELCPAEWQELACCREAQCPPDDPACAPDACPAELDTWNSCISMFPECQDDPNFIFDRCF